MMTRSWIAKVRTRPTPALARFGFSSLIAFHSSNSPTGTMQRRLQFAAIYGVLPVSIRRKFLCQDNRKIE
jgi:hypothetical protein